MVNTFLKYIATIKTLFLKFSLVGISGIFVNEGLLALLTEVFDIKVATAGAIAIETSIITNFLLNNYWTWREFRKDSFLLRFTKYHLVALIAGLVNFLVLIGLTKIGLHHLLSNLVGIACATMINFFLNHHWTFGRPA